MQITAPVGILATVSATRVLVELHSFLTSLICPSFWFFPLFPGNGENNYEP